MAAFDPATGVPAIVAFTVIAGAFYAGDSIMLVRLWRVLRSSDRPERELAAWVLGLAVALFFPPLVVVMVPAAYLRCYRPLLKSAQSQ